MSSSRYKFLDKLKHFRSQDTSINAVAQTLIANIFILVIGVGTGIISARILGPEGRGILAAIIIGPRLLANLLTLGLPPALIYNIKRFPDKVSHFFSTALLLGVIIGILATITGVVFIPHWLSGYSLEVIRFIQWCMLITPLILLNLIFNAILRARGEFSLFNTLRCLPPLLNLFILIMLAIFNRFTPFTVALAYLLHGLPILGWMLLRFWRIYHPVWTGISLAFRDLISYGLRSWGGSSLRVLTTQLDRVLVITLLGPTMVGFYAVAISLSGILGIFQTAVNSVLFPKVSGRPIKEVVARVGLAARVSTIITLLAGIGLIILGPWILGLVYGPAFLGAAGVFRLLALNAIFTCAVRVLVQAFMALDRPGLVTTMQGIWTAICLPLLLLLMPRYGLEGVGLAILISTLSQLIFIMLCFPFILRVPMPRIWMSWGDLKAILHIKGGSPKL